MPTPFAPLLTAAEALPVLSLRLHWRLQRGGWLPQWLGSTLRGSFGHAFKTAVCIVDHRDCGACLLNDRCPYTYLFETPRPAGGSWMRRYDRVPHPFTLQAPAGRNRPWEAGETLEAGFTLFGPAAELLPYLIAAWENLGHTGWGDKRLKAELVQVTAVGPQLTAPEPVYIPGHALADITPLSWPLTALVQPIAPGPVTLRLHTPLTLHIDGAPTRQAPPFDRLISHLLRRLSMILHFHTGQTPELDYAEIIKRAQAVTLEHSTVQWTPFQRHSQRHNRKMVWGGLLGDMTYSAAAAPFVPLLQLGQGLQLGKHTSFGLGAYELLFDPVVQARYQERLQMATQMQQRGLDPALIADVTGILLPQEIC